MITAPREFQIERDYDNRMAHARSMFHMAVQAAEAEMDKALKAAMGIRDAELAEARRGNLSAASEEARTDDCSTVHTCPHMPKCRPGRPSRESVSIELAGLTGVGVTRLTEIRG